MTIDEKRSTLDKYCESSCRECYYFDDEFAWCRVHECWDKVPDKAVEEVYDKIFNNKTTPVTDTDKVNHPSHYNQGEIECIDAMLAAYGKDAVNIFCLLNAFKYLWRAEHKNGNEDLDKAVWYLKKRLELCSNE